MNINMRIRCNNCFEEYDKELGLCPFCGYVEGEQAADVFCLSPGSVIDGRYIIGEKVSSGGFGIVYKAWDRKLETVVAIKEYYPSGLVNRLPGETKVILVAAKREKEFVYGKTRFLEEARNMAKFSSHKNIVNVYQFFEENNTAYIVMEFLDGRTLGEVLQQQSVPLPYDYCINVASEVCSALRAIHKEKILHRDVSPDNIMICKDGTVKLFDFGAARFSASVENRVTVVVKPGFAPPEQYDKINRQDPRTDIYALGATLYYAMTGTRPEESTNRKIEDTLIEPSALDKSIPKNISNTIMRAMAVEKQYRFPDVDEFEKALLSEKKIKSVQKERAKRKRHRFLGILFSLLIVSAAAGAFVYMYNAEKAEASLPDAELDVWYIRTGVDEVDFAKASALDKIVQTFTDEYSNVMVNLTSVDYSDYTSTLETAIKSGDAPEVFESTGLTDFASMGSPAMSEGLNNLEEDSYYSDLLGFDAQYPTGIVVPVIYINTTMESVEEISDIDQLNDICKADNQYFVVKESSTDMYAALYGTGIADYVTDTARDEFFAREACIYFGDSSDYFDVQNTLPGEYSLLMPTTENATYRNGTTWSMSEQDEDTKKSATALLAYFTSDLAQDYFHIQNQSGNLPIVRSSLKEFVGVYDELAAIEEYLSLPFIAPATVESTAQTNGTQELNENEETEESDERNVTTIPNMLSQSNWLEAEEYRPQVVFGEDGQCTFRFNMASWIYDAPATYKVFTCSDGKRLIECDLGSTEFGDGFEHFTSLVFFTETSDGKWIFWSENIGLTFAGSSFNSSETETIEVQGIPVEDTSYAQSGVYQSTGATLNEIRIRSIDDVYTMDFEVFWYRLAGFIGTAYSYGNRAFFNHITEDGYEHTVGYLEFDEIGNATLTILETEISYVEPGIEVFSFVSEEELKSQTEATNLNTLLLNNDSKGWVKDGTAYDEILFRFYENGTVLYWVGTQLGGETTYKENEGTYQLDGSLIYVDDCAYNLTVENTGMTLFYLNSVNEDLQNINGSYVLEENELYQLINQSN